MTAINAHVRKEIFESNNQNFQLSKPKKLTANLMQFEWRKEIIKNKPGINVLKNRSYIKKKKKPEKAHGASLKRFIYFYSLFLPYALNILFIISFIL